MTTRIQIMKVEPMADAEHPLVTVIFDESAGRISIEPQDPKTDTAYWLHLLAGIVGIDPDTEPRAFFDALRDRLDGTYVYAREANGNDDRASSDASRVVGA